MLGKLIKHEFRATGRIILPMMAALIGISLLAGPVMGVITANVASKFVNFVSGLLVFAVVVLLFGVCIASFVLMIQRFYKNIFGDEGYITMTLPVSSDGHIFAKLIVSTVWFAADLIICSAAVLTLMRAWSVEWLRQLLSIPAQLGEYIGGGNVALLIVEGLIAAVLLSFIACLRFYASMAIGCSFGDHKILLSVVAYFLFGAVLNTLSITALIALGKAAFFSGLGTAFFSAVDSPAGAMLSLHGCVWMGIVYLLFIGAVYYIPTTLMMKKRLNLA